MQIIDPTYITDSTLVSSDILAAEALAPEWDETILYRVGMRVSVNDGGYHDIYQCAYENTNEYPPDNLSGTPTYWTHINKTNRWKLFDMIVAPDRANASDNVPGCDWASGVSWQPDTSWMDTTSSSMQITVTPGYIDTVALMNVDAESILIVMTDPSAGEVYNETKNPSTTEAANLIYSDLPNYPSATVEVIARNSGDVNVGELIFGRARTIGTARYGVGVGIVDYSAKAVDDFGNFSITERTFSKRLDVPFTMTLATHAGVLRVLEKLRSIPLVWIIDEAYSTTIAYGYYRDLKISIPNSARAEGTLSIEGLGSDWVHAAPIPDDWVEPWDGIHHLTISIMPIVSVSTDKIEESPVAPSAIALSVLMPSVSATTAAYALAGADGVCTISNGEPALVTINTHGLSDDQEVIFHTTGTLPAPLTVNTVYYVMYLDANTFNLSLTIGGSSIDTTTDGSGTHTVLGKV